MKLFCVIGEESGDIHGGSVLRVMKEAQPDMEIYGTGGRIFSSLADKVIFSLRDLEVIGFWEVLKQYRSLKSKLDTIVSEILNQKPDAVLLVDYPGMNLRIAEAIKGSGIPIFYYISPQVWAWKKKRIFKIKELVDHMVVLFPFEKDYFHKEADMSVECFGHPLLGLKKKYIKPEKMPEGGLNIILMPGSRMGEIAAHMPLLLESALLFTKERSDVNFFLLKPDDIPQDAYPSEILSRFPNLSVVKEDHYSYLSHADIVWCTSGTSTLESAILETPPVIFYKTSKLTYFLAEKVFGIEMVGLPNVLLKRKAFPEILKEPYAKMMKVSTEKLLKEVESGELRDTFKNIENALGERGAYEKTAEYFLSCLKSK